MKMVPPPSPEPNGKGGLGWSALGMSNMELGDRVEAAIVDQLGWTPLVGARAGRVRQGPFDLIDPKGRVVEVKACAVGAKEYKIKSSAHSVLAKVKAAREMGATPCSLIAVVEANGRAWLYRRNGIGCFRLPRDGAGWKFVGNVQI